MQRRLLFISGMTVAMCATTLVPRSSAAICAGDYRRADLAEVSRIQAGREVGEDGRLFILRELGDWSDGHLQPAPTGDTADCFVSLDLIDSPVGCLELGCIP